MWTTQEEVVLERAVKEDKPVEEIADLLGKSKGAVRQKIRRGCRKSDRYWTEDDERFLIKRYNDESAERLAEMLGRSKAAIRNKYQRLKNQNK